MNGAEPSDVVRRIANAIAIAEGYYVAGSLPHRRNNPGSIVDPATGQLRQYPSPEAGWDALYWQVERMLSGESPYYPRGITLRQAAVIYTGNDNPEGWARTVSQHTGIPLDAVLAEIA